MIFRIFFHFSAVLILGFYFVWEWFGFCRKRVEKQVLANCTQNVFVWKGCGFGVPSFGPWIHSRFVIDSIPPQSVLRHLRLCVNWNPQSFCLLHCQFNLRLCICSSRRGGWNSKALSIKHILYVLQHMWYMYIHYVHSSFCLKTSSSPITPRYSMWKFLFFCNISFDGTCSRWCLCSYATGTAVPRHCASSVVGWTIGFRGVAGPRSERIQRAMPWE